jgi:hypothetical protein
MKGHYGNVNVNENEGCWLGECGNGSAGEGSLGVGIDGGSCVGVVRFLDGISNSLGLYQYIWI